MSHHFYRHETDERNGHNRIRTSTSRFPTKIVKNHLLELIHFWNLCTSIELKRHSLLPQLDNVFLPKMLALVMYPQF